MDTTLDRTKLKNKYIFSAKLVMESALHVGGGKQNLTNTDSPVVRTPDGLPYIPGSSFKGVFRSTAEKMAHALGLKTCALEPDKHSRIYSEGICIPPEMSTSKSLQLESLEYLEENLCDTCKLFGSSYIASKIFFKDLYLTREDKEEVWAGATQIRDGVMIDRDAERASPGKKYDFEIVPVGAKFDVSIELENASKNDLALVYAVLLDFKHGFGRIGGNVSRGTGKFRLDELKIKKVDMTDENQFINYLLKGKDGMTDVGESEIGTFIDDFLKQ